MKKILLLGAMLVGTSFMAKGDEVSQWNFVEHHLLSKHIAIVAGCCGLAVGVPIGVLSDFALLVKACADCLRECCSGKCDYLKNMNGQNSNEFILKKFFLSDCIAGCIGVVAGGVGLLVGYKVVAPILIASLRLGDYLSAWPMNKSLTPQELHPLLEEAHAQYSKKGFMYLLLNASSVIKQIQALFDAHNAAVQK